ncbi:MAG TPA: ABC transporter ATP-binding protein [Actinomycetota bacterium]|nr:ABC transporter ATP-binding protein [Actinomycetota bacterium]
MSIPVIEIEGLRKVYRRLRGRPQIAVAGLDLVVPAGGVFGFLGPNGAGKTTTIRCLLGLVRPSGGRAAVLGADSQASLAGVIGRIGSIVETPVLYPGFSGRRNLLLLGRPQGIGRRRVDEVLEQVGLAQRAGDLVKGYSQGMRQRLGIGAALLKDPEVLILDEPANALDPAGIKEVRTLLRRLGDEGRTVFVSSHILNEVQQTSDRVAILARGSAVASGPVQEVIASGHSARLIVGLPEAEREPGLAALDRAGFTAVADQDRILVEAPKERAAEVTRALAVNGLYVTELREEEVSLEDIFLELTREHPGEAAP